MIIRSISTHPDFMKNLLSLIIKLKEKQIDVITLLQQTLNNAQ